jgi:hypothetical protein
MPRRPGGGKRADGAMSMAAKRRAAGSGATRRAIRDGLRDELVKFEYEKFSRR